MQPVRWFKKHVTTSTAAVKKIVARFNTWLFESLTDVQYGIDHKPQQLPTPYGQRDKPMQWQGSHSGVWWS